MEKTLKVYSNGEVVGSQVANKDGATTVTITGLEAGKTYTKGTFQVAFANDSGESEKVDVPEFTTTASKEEPKAEEPKAEEPKAEEPKAEEPKAEEPKADAES